MDLIRTDNAFQKGTLIGKGGFSKVIKYEHQLDGMSYAIKVLPLHPSDIDNVLNIINEVRILARLNHTNIVRYFNAWIEETSSFVDDIKSLQDEEDESTEPPRPSFNSPLKCHIQLELCDLNLRTYLTNRLGVNVQQSSDIFHQILEGVSYLHRHNIIHADLKPENVLMKITDNTILVKISDFGLSKHNDSHTITPYGTALYKMNDQEPLTSGSDVFSLAIILFELYSQFYTAMERIITIRRLRQTTIPPSLFEEDYPLESMVIRMMLSNHRPSVRAIQRILLIPSNDPYIFCRDIIWESIMKAMN